MAKFHILQALMALLLVFHCLQASCLRQTPSILTDNGVMEEDDHKAAAIADSINSNQACYRRNRFLGMMGLDYEDAHANRKHDPTPNEGGSGSKKPMEIPGL